MTLLSNISTRRKFWSQATYASSRRFNFSNLFLHAYSNFVQSLWSRDLVEAPTAKKFYGEEACLWCIFVRLLLGHNTQCLLCFIVHTVLQATLLLGRSVKVSTIKHGGHNRSDVHSAIHSWYPPPCHTFPLLLSAIPILIVCD